MNIGNLEIKNILIIRSTHLEHLDLVLKKVREVFGQARVSILTHLHAAKTLDEDLVSIIPYEERGDFSVFRIKALRSKGMPGRGFDLIVVPFNNESGSGYLNVILLAFGIKSNLRMSCNVDGQLRRIGYGYLIKRLLVAALSSTFAIIGTAIFALPTLFFLQRVTMKYKNIKT